MKNVGIDSLLETARLYDKDGVAWHHHFLTPRCALNDSASFRIILENEENGDACCAEFQEKPMKELEQLEALFFKRKT